MKAFISWAHRGEEWSDTQAQLWLKTVETFARLLDAVEDVDVTLDLWHEHDRDLDWTRWGPKQVEDSDFVLIALNGPWGERWKGNNNPHVGSGSVAEADTLHGLFYADQVEFQKKVRVVILPGALPRNIPLDLWRSKRLVVSVVGPDSIESVVKELRGESRQTQSTGEVLLTEDVSLGSPPAFLPGDMLLFRYRNLPQPTIKHHQKVLRKNPGGYVWWGWWKKYEENPQIELWEAFRNLVENGSVRIALFDSGSPNGEVRRATVTDVLCPRLNEFGDSQPFTPDPTEWQFIPEYYRPSEPDDTISRAWIRLAAIEDRPFGFYGHYEFVSADMSLSGVIIREQAQLKTLDQSVWHIRRTSA